jgi:hypothetical protein
MGFENELRFLFKSLGRERYVWFPYILKNNFQKFIRLSIGDI